MNRHERAAANQALFRGANEDIEEARRRYRFDGDRAPYICECADPACTAIILLAADEYGEVRSGADRFVVVPGHELEWERVRSKSDGYLIVEKPS